MVARFIFCNHGTKASILTLASEDKTIYKKMRIPSIMMELDFVFFLVHMKRLNVHTGTVFLSKSGAKVLLFFDMTK